MFSTRAEGRQREGERERGRESCWICKGACECLELPLHYLHHILRGTGRQAGGMGGREWRTYSESITK